jgi:putative ATPase
MKELGYAEGYEYDPETETGVSEQRYLPDGVEPGPLYRPGPFGFEKQLADRMRWFAEQRGAARRTSESKDVGGE